MPREITKVTLATSREAFWALVEAADKPRADVKNVFVDRDMLKHLLYDHSQLMEIVTQDFSWVTIRIEKEGDLEAQEESVLAFLEYRDIRIKKLEELKTIFVPQESNTISTGDQETDQNATENVAEATENDEQET